MDIQKFRERDMARRAKKHAHKPQHTEPTYRNLEDLVRADKQNQRRLLLEAIEARTEQVEYSKEARRMVEAYRKVFEAERSVGLVFGDTQQLGAFLNGAHDASRLRSWPYRRWAQGMEERLAAKVRRFDRIINELNAEKRAAQMQLDHLNGRRNKKS